MIESCLLILDFCKDKVGVPGGCLGLCVDTGLVLLLCIQMLNTGFQDLIAFNPAGDPHLHQLLLFKPCPLKFSLIGY